MEQIATGGRNPLPKTLAGVVCAQRVRCGKRTCHCATGEKHLAFYRFWREDGVLQKAYVRRSELEQTRAACDRRRKDEEWMKRLVTGPDAMSVKREIRATLRRYDAPARILRRYR